MDILFVCTGNTCRSPMAEAILLHISQGDLCVSSAGVFATNGMLASSNAIETIKNANIYSEHRSKLLTELNVNKASLVLTMTEQHRDVIHKLYPLYKEKVYTLKEYVGENNKSQDIIDPYGGTLKTYQNTFDELYYYIEKLHQTIMNDKKEEIKNENCSSK